MGAFALLGIWIASYVHDLTDHQNGMIRLVLGCLLALLILLRAPSPRDPPVRSLPAWTAALLASIAVLLFGAGTALNVHQLSWIAVLLLSYSGLAISLPDRFLNNLLPSLFILYWIHWLPDQLFSAFQFFMQAASVRASEWVLHMFNVRVWADQFFLQTMARTFEIPEACSGMRTATTVFILAMGLGIQFRLRRLDFLLVMFLAVLQALLLNIVRICLIVCFSPPPGADSSTEVVHDASGMVVLGTLVLVTCEIIALASRRHRESLPEQPFTHDQSLPFSDLPPFWQYILDHRVRLLIIAGALALAGGLAFKNRPYHRASMIKDVALFLRDNDKLDAAQRCADQALLLQPADIEWHFVVLRIKIMRGRYADVLADLKSIPDADAESTIAKRILQAYAHMGLHQMAEAAAVVAGLPEFERDTNPMVAMVLAELGRYAGDPDEVARHLAMASTWRPNTVRVRAMYPYLRIYRKWEAITHSVGKAPFRRLPDGLSAVEAFLNLKRTGDAADLSLRLMKAWPADPSLLEPLFYLASTGEKDWESRFSDHLQRCIAGIDQIDTLATFFDKCFTLGRPDLAWIVYRRIETLDPKHPILPATLLRYGDKWFLFRKRSLGMSAPFSTDSANMCNFIAAARLINPLSPYLAIIPESTVLSASDITASRKLAMKRAIDEFALLHKDKRLSLAMQYEYAAVQEWADDREGARGTLADIVTAFPDQEERARLTLSEMYERSAEWDRVYEILRRYPEQKNCSLIPLLRLCEAQLHLKLIIGALHTAQFIHQKFPESGMAGSMLAAVLTELDSPEEALFVLGQKSLWREREMDLQEAIAIYRTQRYSELNSFCQSALLPSPDIAKDSPQAFFSKPAELAALWHLTSLPRDADFATAADTIRKNRDTTHSPFLKQLLTLWVQAYEARLSDPALANPDRWLATGRDRQEKAMALNQLTLFLAWQNQFNKARDVAGLAVKQLPTSPLLWRILISLTHVSPEVVQQAIYHCPDDPTIWLSALLVARKHPGTSTNQTPTPNLILTNLIANPDVISQRFPPDAITRGADYLYRRGLCAEAAALMKPVTPIARGFLPSYILGLKCALDQTNQPWATQCARDAITASLRPLAPLFQTLVNLKSTGNDPDFDLEMVNALLNLRMLAPNDPLWPQLLGYVRYKRGGWEYADSFHEMEKAIENGATNRTPFIVAAETSRLLGNPARAVDILRRALTLHPDDPAIMNNLAYTLLDQPDGAPEALTLVKQLTQYAATEPEAQDTTAWVYFRNGKKEEALALATEIGAKATRGSPLWFRANLLMTEVAVQEGRLTDAQDLLKELFKKSSDISNEDILSATRLLVTVQERLQPDRSPTHQPDNRKDNRGPSDE